jgi:hypothetical protein
MRAERKKCFKFGSWIRIISPRSLQKRKDLMVIRWLLLFQYALNINNHGDMKIYMDVCCLFRPFDDRTQDRIRIESEAVLTILSRCSEDWTLVGSDAIDFELSAVMDPKKRTDAFILASIAKEKIETDRGIIDRAIELGRLGFRPIDSAHISYAERAADIMFTVDDDILRVARIKRGQVSIEIENPARWLLNVFQG